MKKRLSLLLKIVCGMVVLLIILLVSAVVVLNQRSVQKRLAYRATEMLSEKFGTEVAIDSFYVDLLSLDVVLEGLKVNDLQHREMLRLGYLKADIALWPLLTRNVVINGGEVDNLKACLYKEENEPANYQFIADVIKNDLPKKKEKKPEEEGKKKHPLKFDVRDLRIRNLDISYNENTFKLERLLYHEQWVGTRRGSLARLQGKVSKQTKKGIVTHEVGIGQLTVIEEGDYVLVGIDSLRYKNDNHLPRKNSGKPKRGFFDAGHLDVLAHLDLTINHMANDSLNLTLTNCTARDSVTGFNVRDLSLTAGINKEKVSLHDVFLQHDSTVLRFDSASVTLPNKKRGVGLAYQTSEITGRTLLRDIARPFAPVLSRFTIPLNLKVRLSGTDSTMQFRDIRVNTDRKKLALSASGGITNLKSKERLAIRFHVGRMTTDGATAQQFINLFAVKKFMMKQLNALGTIQYTGDVAILRKREEFKGTLQTVPGKMLFNLAIDENTKYISGHVATKAFQLGKVLEMKELGPVGCTADFTFDISKPRTALVRKEKGGKLPIGSVDAVVQEASYMKIKVKNVDVKIVSDGAVANGSLNEKTKKLNISCDFTFTNTDAISKNLKVKPRVKLINMPWQKKKDKEGAEEKKSSDGQASGEAPKEKKSLWKKIFKK